ncbi:hypothetical protein SNEBB_000808 [Seison nebaliae]|nr:hypothetical protein SNEBB_000808 [Seison nebaliae]
MKLAACTGGETFNCVFMPVVYWFWQSDVARRMCLIWGSLMYIGQAMKDILKIPRPQTPIVHHLEKAYVTEYGMPSTHAIVAICIPYTLYYYSLQIMELNEFIFCGILIFWSVSTCISRVYLGMHSVLDVIIGSLLAWSGTYMLIDSKLINFIEDELIMNKCLSMSLVTLTTCIFLCLIYPQLNEKNYEQFIELKEDDIEINSETITIDMNKKCCDTKSKRIWNSARSDAFLIISVICGIIVGSKILFLRLPYTIYSTTSLHRTLFCGTDKIVDQLRKYNNISQQITSIPMTIIPLTIENYKKQFFPELFYKFSTYFLVSFVVVYICPQIFTYIETISLNLS